MKIQLYKDNEKQWRARIINKGNILFVSSEGYTHRGDLLNVIKSIRESLPKITETFIIELDGSKVTNKYTVSLD
jgi:uncharacterized protein YegP (UPF0339 family)